MRRRLLPRSDPISTTTLILTASAPSQVRPDQHHHAYSHCSFPRRPPAAWSCSNSSTCRTHHRELPPRPPWQPTRRLPHASTQRARSLTPAPQPCHRSHQRLSVAPSLTPAHQRCAIAHASARALPRRSRQLHRVAPSVTQRPSVCAVSQASALPVAPSFTPVRSRRVARPPAVAPCDVTPLASSGHQSAIAGQPILAQRAPRRWPDAPRR